MSAKKFFFLFLLACMSGAGKAGAQIINDQAIQQTASQVLQNTYNMQFSTARSLNETIGEKYPQHPVYPFLKAYILSWEYFPLATYKSSYATYQTHINSCIDKALAMLKKNDKSVEGIFFAMMGYSLLALHEAEGDAMMNAVGYGKKAFTYMKKGFDLGGVLPDFYFSTGLYKYYAEQYPETRPIAKPFMSFFPYGSRQEGLYNLTLASQLGKFSQVEALIYLNSIYVKYEQNPYMASDYAYKLVTMYPHQPFFWLKYAEQLVLLGRYAEAEVYFSKFNTRTERVYVIGSNTLQGLVQEKYYKNAEKAQLAYEKATQYDTYDARYSKDYVAFAYVGLGRVAHDKGNTKTAREYYKKAKDLAEYKSLLQEIKAYLKN